MKRNGSTDRIGPRITRRGFVQAGSGLLGVSLPGLLAEYQIGHLHVPALGGRRKVQPDFPEGLNAAWRNQSFHNYADYALGDEFAGAFRELVDRGLERRVTLMCSEAVWWRCHRRIIADYLLLNGHEVDHLIGPGHVDHATATPGALKTPEGKVVYPAVAQ